jgi:hypothetical protein
MVTLGNAAMRAQKTSMKTIEDGAPEEIRTPDPQIRSSKSAIRDTIRMPF